MTVRPGWSCCGPERRLKVTGLEEESGILASGLEGVPSQIRNKARHRVTAGSMGQLRLLLRSNCVNAPSQFDVNRAFGAAAAG